MLDNSDIYSLIETQFTTYADLSDIEIVAIDDATVSLRESGFRFSVGEGFIERSSADDIFVRAGVLERLIMAQEWLGQNFKGVFLEVIYGWRSLEIQCSQFDKICHSYGYPIGEKNLSLGQLEQVHRFIAVPSVAGHPTGGAVDVVLRSSGGDILDFGTRPHDFVPDSYVFSPFIGRDAFLNRQKLRAAMMSAGFAPFDGEWWHFSFGDREWAYFYNRQCALYGSIHIEGNNEIPL